MSHQSNNQQLFKQIKKLNEIGKALSLEKNKKKLLEKILLSARELTGADAGTLYTVTKDNKLKFEFIQNETLKINKSIEEKESSQFPSIPLFDNKKNPNTCMVAAYAVLNKHTSNIEDAYKVAGFDFSGTREFDEKSGYRSKSFLTVPLKNHEDQIIGVLQLINAKKDEKIVSFTEDHQQLVESLASQVAISITNHNFIDTLNAMFENFIQAIGDAIDEKSPYTGQHCRRVTIITKMLAEAVNKTKLAPYEKFSFTESEIYELYVASWLHDCGKISTPTHIVDKATRLEMITDRIEIIMHRFELLKRHLEVSYLNQKNKVLQEGGHPDKLKRLEKGYKEYVTQVNQDQQFIMLCNSSETLVDDEMKKRIKKIGTYTVTFFDNTKEKLLNENEIECLSIPRGTLSKGEKKIVDKHVSTTIKILNNLTYPENLKNVPEIAGAHHERVDGKGYPNQLTKDQMSVQARILGIADIFEALTSLDRPYKKEHMPLSKALRILENMKEDGHIDSEIFEVFKKEKVYKEYAKKHLTAAQIDV